MEDSNSFARLLCVPRLEHLPQGGTDHENRDTCLPLGLENAEDLVEDLAQALG